MNIIFHYTTGTRLGQILNSEVLLPEADVPASFYGRTPRYTKAQWDFMGIPSAVWFTQETDMPFTAMPAIHESGIQIYQAEQLSRTLGYHAWQDTARGIYRLSFDADEVPVQSYWREVRQAPCVNLSFRKAFESRARHGGDNPRKWFCVSQPVPMSQCLKIETWRDGDWREEDQETLDAERNYIASLKPTAVHVFRV